MSEVVVLDAIIKDGVGKGASRQMRRDGVYPCHCIWWWF